MRLAVRSHGVQPVGFALDPGLSTLPMLRFTKMHGAGNDYVYVDCFEHELPQDIPALARAMSDRHTGIGADGLILICPAEDADPQRVAGADTVSQVNRTLTGASLRSGPGHPEDKSPGEHASVFDKTPAITPDVRMRVWNADGSAGEMCGNGIRCVAKFLYEHRKLQQDVLHIATDGGIRRLELIVQNGRVHQVRVNMGRPVLQAELIPTTLAGNPPLDVMLPLTGSPITGINQIAVSAISMGNPHCVTFVEELNDQMVHVIGPSIEHHPAFPNRVNAEFVQVLSPQEINMRVWERGSGETQACGSGACAALVAGVLTGRTEPAVTCHLPGGELQLEWRDRKDVYMTGPAVEVFSGEWPVEDGG